MVVDFEGVWPALGEGVFVAPNATVLGRVSLGDRASIWYGAVLRGDMGEIEVGAESNIQDNAVIHTSPERPTRIGARVTVGHGAILEACRIEDGALIGMGAVVLNGAVVEKGAVVAAGCVVREGQIIPAGHLAAGVPARIRKPAEGSSLQWVQRAAEEYLEFARRHRRLWEGKGGK